MDKSPWDSIAIFISFCDPFRNYLTVLPPPPYTKLKLGKILDTRVQHCLWGEGRGWTCVNWKMSQKCKSVPRRLYMIAAIMTPEGGS